MFDFEYRARAKDIFRDWDRDSFVPSVKIYRSLFWKLRIKSFIWQIYSTYLYQNY